MSSQTLSRDDVIARLAAAVPAGRKALSTDEWDLLLTHTADLLTVSSDTGLRELCRFQDIKNRSMHVDQLALQRAHNGMTIMVTGGTGCIGSSLFRELSRLRPGRLVSVSRGVSETWTLVPGVEYHHLDIRDGDRLCEEFDAVKPDIVYHCAAQHDPGLAEIEIARTLSTNVTGTANVIAACRPHRSTLVHASTGKALRPFSRDVYAASKKISEWLLAEAMGTDPMVAATVRFTHVVDNSLIYQRLRGWTKSGSPIRLHSPDVCFYLQSAREAAQLLMCAAVDAVGNELRVNAIRDLGWPVSLIDLALGTLASSNDASNNDMVPLYICGFEAGYDCGGYPGLYDPSASGDRSPLFNALEVPHAVTSRHCPDVDRFSVEPQKDAATRALIQRLGTAAADGSGPELLRSRIEECGWAVLSSSVAALPLPNLARHLDLVQRVPNHDFDHNDRAVVNLVFWESHRRRQEQNATQLAGQQVPAIEPETATARAAVPATPSADGSVVDLTVLIPIRDHRVNIPELIERLGAVCRSDTVEILFIDESPDHTDSPEDTTALITAAAAAGLQVRHLRRPPADRTGRPGAVASGARSARGRYLVVMDPDLRHPPELIPILRELIDEPGVEVVAASRYLGGPGPTGWEGLRRQWSANRATLAARAVFPYRVGRACSDPMTGFFCLDRRAVDLDRLGLGSGATLLQILVKQDVTVREIPYVVEDVHPNRRRGAWVERATFLRQLAELRCSRP